jgi:hypothetical protein
MENRIKLIAWITTQMETVSASILEETKKLVNMDTKVLAKLTTELHEWQTLLAENTDKTNAPKKENIAEAAIRAMRQSQWPAHKVDIFQHGFISRPDGYILFPTKGEALAYITEQTKDRTGPAPEEYCSYTYVGVVEIDSRTHEKLMERGCLGFD